MVSPALARFLVPGTDPDVAAVYDGLAAHAADRGFGFEDEVVYLDVETTGFDRRDDRLIEIAAIKARGPEEVDRFRTLVDPGRRIPRETTALTGIDDAMVRGAPSPGEAVGSFSRFADGADMVAHNVAFDRAFLTAAARDAGVGPTGEWLCSLRLSRIALPRLRSHRLADLAAAFGIGEAPHRAEPDAEAVFALWRICLAALDGMPPEVVSAVAGISSDTAWPLRKVVSHVAAGRPSPPADLKDMRRAATRGRAREELADADAVRLTGSTREAIEAEFGEGGVVDRMYPDYERREEQLVMAEGVRAALCEGRHLAVEAGTGVGKSVAYLVPAVTFALENGVAVGVATKTNALTDQLVYGELPALGGTLMRDLDHVALKGYEHYLCLRKFDRMLADEGLSQDAVVDAAMLLTWAAQSGWGDIDAVNLHWRPELRTAVTAGSVDCTRRRCRYFPDLCYLHGTRKRAAGAHVVVTNHALLFRDLMTGGGILPPVRHWVVDEAHAAEEEARKQLSVGADHGSLRATLRGLTGRKGGPLTTLSSHFGDIDDGDMREEAYELVERMRGHARTALTVTDSFFSELKSLPGGAESGYDREEVRITPTLREAHEWSVAAGVGRSLARHLGGLVDDGRRLFTLMEEAGLRWTDDRADLAGRLSRAQSALEGLLTVLEGEQSEYVYSATVDRRPEAVSGALTAQALDVGEVLATTFFPDVRTAVFSSATIAAGDDFSHLARGVGLERLEEGSWSAMRLPSSYDFERQMAAFVPSDLPEPNQDGYLRELERFLFDLHVAMGGSVLTLFTNRRDLARLHRSLAPRLEAEGLRLVAQRRGSTKRVRDEFVADEATSLFATKSFWEGFDAKGDTLRCVAVVRLPFAHPGDPLLEELKERDPANWWSRHYLPRAVIELKQAAGRLIRSGTDEGCLIICDTRIVGRKSYGRAFLEALPVHDVAVVASDVVIEAVTSRFGRV